MGASLRAQIEEKHVSGTRRPKAPQPKKAAAKKSAAKAQRGFKRFVSQALGLGQRGGPGLWLQRALVVLIVLVVILGGIFVVAYQATTIPDPNSAYAAQASYVMYDDGTKVGQYGTQNREVIALADMPKVLQDAVVAAEDRSFWTNRGIDPRGILRAFFSNAEGNATQGGSTITQQYVKLLYLNSEQTLTRKIKEAFLALKVQQEQSKQQVLEGYLNAVYFGRGAYGIQAAARAYFGVDAKQLNLAQSAMLASVINQPSRLAPDGTDDQRRELLDRYNYVLDGMVSMGTASSSDADAVRTHLPDVAPASSGNVLGGQKGFIMAMVKAELLKIGFTDQQISGAGLRVTTTLNQGAMTAEEAAVTSVAPQKLDQLHVGAASIDVKTGKLIGFYGGQDFIKSQINYATYGDSPGSVFKVFALSMALSNGWSLNNTFDGNSPFVLPGCKNASATGCSIQNEGERAGIKNGTSYGSNVPLLRGLMESINTVFMDMVTSTDKGPQKVRDTAVKMGVPDKSTLVANTGIALGSAPVAPVDIANAYSTIANNGNAHPWYMVQQVTDAKGRVLWTHQDKETQALNPDVAADVSYAMQQVVAGGTGVNAQALGRPAAGKTGTATDDAGDVVTSWFSGFTPDIATAVMYVRGNGRQPINGYLPTYFGADFPTRTWTAIMGKLTANTPVSQFPPRGNIQPTQTSGKHAPYTPPPAPSPTAAPTDGGAQPPAPTDTTPPNPQPVPPGNGGPNQQGGIVGGLFGGLLLPASLRVRARRRRR